MHRVPALFALTLAACLTTSLALPVAAAQKQEAVTIKEWPVPWPDTHPAAPFVAGAQVWFAGSAGHYLGTLDPQTGTFKRIDLIDEPGPQSVIVAANGMVWFSGPLHGYIGRFDPVSRRVAHMSMPSEVASDPRTLMFELGERNIWFTAPEGNIVGRFRIDTGIFDVLGVSVHGARPDGIASAANGTPWFALSGTNQLAQVDPASFIITQYPLPRAAARPRRIAFSSDGRVWYVDFAEGYLGVFTPATKATKEWRFPAGKNSLPYGMALDAKDRVWAVETGVQPNRLVGFDPKTEAFFSTTAVPSGGGSIANLRYDRPTGRMWFATEKGTIGFANVN
jgi:virginiamycin B lyase